MGQKVKYRLGIISIALLIAFAVVCDVIGLIPLAKDITGTVFWATAGFYLWYRGLGLLNWKKAATMAISWISAMIPGIQELPIELTAGIVALIIISRIEDKTGLKALKTMDGGKMPPPLNKNGVRIAKDSRSPLNEGGMRLPQGGLGTA